MTGKEKGKFAEKLSSKNYEKKANRLQDNLII